MLAPPRAQAPQPPVLSSDPEAPRRRRE